jgi:hypothetical protein
MPATTSRTAHAGDRMVEHAFCSVGPNAEDAPCREIILTWELAGLPFHGIASPPVARDLQASFGMSGAGWRRDGVPAKWSSTGHSGNGKCPLPGTPRPRPPAVFVRGGGTRMPHAARIFVRSAPLGRGARARWARDFGEGGAGTHQNVQRDHRELEHRWTRRNCAPGASRAEPRQNIEPLPSLHAQAADTEAPPGGSWA